MMQTCSRKSFQYQFYSLQLYSFLFIYKSQSNVNTIILIVDASKRTRENVTRYVLILQWYNAKSYKLSICFNDN